MKSYTRISDEKDARWHAIRHRIQMDRLRLDTERLRIAEERNRVAKSTAHPSVCSHCGHALNQGSQKRR